MACIAAKSAALRAVAHRGSSATASQAAAAHAKSHVGHGKADARGRRARGNPRAMVAAMSSYIFLGFFSTAPHNASALYMFTTFLVPDDVGY